MVFSVMFSVVKSFIGGTLALEGFMLKLSKSSKAEWSKTMGERFRGVVK